VNRDFFCLDCGRCFQLCVDHRRSHAGYTQLSGFLSIEGVMIVVGGTLAVAFMSYQANYVIEALKGIGLMFRKADVTMRISTAI